ncbi:E1-E2 ATPase-domain-containing protein [Amanita rubescens]|nr:E1-E2 ATPase-domain-containing protein [Amanita rubescens]
MWNPLSWVIEAAALVAIVLSNGDGSVVRQLGECCQGAHIRLLPKQRLNATAHGQKLNPLISEAVNVSIDQAALTGESLPQSKKAGDQCFSGPTCKQGEAKGVVISTGANTFFGRAASLVGHDDDNTGHLQKILSQIGTFCIASIGIFIIAEIFCLYAGFRYKYRRGLNDILVLLIGGIPIAMPTVLSVTLAVGAQQLAKHKAIVTRITAIEELAGVTILSEVIILLSAYASRTENQDAIDAAVITALGDLPRARAGIKILDFKPFNHIDKRTEATYREEATGKLRLKRTEEIENRLEADIEEFASCGLRALAVAYEELEDDDPEAEGNGFELIGLLPVIDPPREDTKSTIDDALALGVRVKMITVLKDGPPPGGKFSSLDDLILDADGFAGVFPEHKYEIVKRLQGLGHLCAMTGDGANDAPALSRANVGIAVEGATDAARGAADIVLTEPGLSTIVHAIRGSRIVFQRCATTPFMPAPSLFVSLSASPFWLSLSSLRCLGRFYNVWVIWRRKRRWGGGMLILRS